MLSNSTLILPDPLAISLTKPACHLGVPLTAFYFNVMACFILAMFFMSMTHGGIGIACIFLALFILVHIGMVLVSFKDSFGLTIFGMNFFFFRQTAYFKQWGNTDSYSP